MTSTAYFSAIKRNRDWIDADYVAMKFADFETKWTPSDTSPIVAALKSAEFAEIKPSSRIFFRDCAVEYLQETIRVHRLICELSKKHEN